MLESRFERKRRKRKKEWEEERESGCLGFYLTQKLLDTVGTDDIFK